MPIVHFKRATRPSALALARALRDENYEGVNINFGFGVNSDGLNSPEAIANASNKRKALEIMCEAEVPIPPLYTPDEAYEAVLDAPLVGRKNYHRKGRGFYYCEDEDDVEHAIRKGATHFLEYITDTREFRAHIVNGNCIKISEKHGDGLTRNVEAGAVFSYPHDFNHKKSLRKVAKQAVEALGLDFGAVDVLYKDKQFYTLEVNTAPCLTNERSDTLSRYVNAFLENSGGHVPSTADNAVAATLRAVQGSASVRRPSTYRSMLSRFGGF